MKKQDHVLIVSLFLIATIMFLSSVYEENLTGNVIEKDLELSNCYEYNSFKICDVTYPDGRLKEKGYRELIIYP